MASPENSASSMRYIPDVILDDNSYFDGTFLDRDQNLVTYKSAEGFLNGKAVKVVQMEDEEGQGLQIIEDPSSKTKAQSTYIVEDQTSP